MNAAIATLKLPGDLQSVLHISCKQHTAAGPQIQAGGTQLVGQIPDVTKHAGTHWVGLQHLAPHPQE
jgi:hypothetical protein